MKIIDYWFLIGILERFNNLGFNFILNMKLERSKGTRDFLPEEQIVRNEIVDALKNVFEAYGFSPLETPSIERFDVLSSKYTGGAEILKETFNLRLLGKLVENLK